jgi:hypothetical protein
LPGLQNAENTVPTIFLYLNLTATTAQMASPFLFLIGSQKEINSVMVRRKNKK